VGRPRYLSKKAGVTSPGLLALNTVTKRKQIWLKPEAYTIEQKKRSFMQTKQNVHDAEVLGELASTRANPVLFAKERDEFGKLGLVTCPYMVDLCKTKAIIKILRSTL
jgi:hypothetical protein